MGSLYTNLGIYKAVSVSHYIFVLHLLELGPTPAHDLSLADKLSVELTAVKCEVYIKVYPVKGTLGCIHAFEISFEVLPRQIRRECDDFLDACD